MATSTSREAMQDKRSQIPQPDAVDEVLSVLRNLADSSNFASLKARIEENATLHDTVKSLENAVATTALSLARKHTESQETDARHQQELETQKTLLNTAIKDKNKAEEELAAERSKAKDKIDQIEKQEKQVKNLISQNKAKDVRISELENIEREKDALVSQLAEKGAALESKSEQLDTVSKNLKLVQSFVVQLSSLEGDEGQRGRICATLETMFRKARLFMSKWLNVDLSESCLSDVKCWEGLRNNPAIHRSIPLPPSNSTPAKSMRVAAGLSVYARALAKHIMRPTYILRDDEALEAFAELTKHDPEQEAFVRSVLLKAFPNRQVLAREALVKMVVADVVEALGWLVPSTQREHFQDGLKGVTGNIANGWSHTQVLEEAVRPSFVLDYTQEWTALPRLPGLGATTQKAKQQQQQQQESGSQEQEADGEVARPVWPSLICYDPEHDMEALLHHGYGLTESQMSHAIEECSRRTQRQAARQAGPAPRKRRDSAVFLSSNGLGQLNGG